MRSLLRPRSLEATSGAVLPLQLTALLLLVDIQYLPVWYLRVGVMALAALGLLFSPILRTPAVWLVLSLLTAGRVLRLWPLEDNHQYLVAYWVLSIFLALCLPRPDKALAVSARWLVAFTFLWAILWKGVLSPDYLDGRFFRVSLFSDPRFAEKTQIITGLSGDAVAQTRAYLEPTPAAIDNVLSRPQWLDSGRVSTLATILTWSTLLVEVAMALAFVLSWGRWSPYVRNILLIGFCLVTYAIAPVMAFGWVLAAIGIAQVPESSRGWRRAYVVLFFVILFVRDVPWEQLIISLRRGLTG